MMMKYHTATAYMDDTIPGEQERLMDLQQRMIGNCAELIQLLKADDSQWSIRCQAHLSVLRAMLMDDKEKTNRQQLKANSQKQ